MKLYKTSAKIFISMNLLWTSPNFVWAIEYDKKINKQRVDKANENLEENIQRETHGVRNLKHLELVAGRNTLQEYKNLSEAERAQLDEQSKQIIQTSGCDVLSREAEKREKDALLFEEKLHAQDYDPETGHYTKIEDLRNQLQAKISLMQGQVTSIGPLASKQGSTIDKRNELKAELVELEKSVPSLTHRKESAERSLQECSGDRGMRCSQTEFSARKRAFESAKSSYNEHMARISYVKNRIWTIVNVDGRAQTANADKAVAKANGTAMEVERLYNLLNQEISKKAAQNEQALDLALERLEEAKQESQSNLKDSNMSTNASFKLGNEYKNSLGTTSENDPENLKRVESDLDVLAMASSGLNLLTCENLSDVKVKSYELFKAASANYLASLINERTEFSKMNNGCVIKCVSLEAIKEDQENGSPKYSGFKDKDLETIKSNCKTIANTDGMMVNDPNADEDKDEQIKAIERAANLQSQLVTNIALKKVHRKDAAKMFKDAYNAALMEMTTKQTRVASARAQLERAKAWEQKAKNSILIYVAIVGTLASCAWSPCSYQYGVAVALLLWHRKDLNKAKKDVAKWERKLRESKMHGHLACNYPGESDKEVSYVGPKQGETHNLNKFNAQFALMRIPEQMKIIYSKDEVWEATNKAPELLGEQFLLEHNEFSAHIKKALPYIFNEELESFKNPKTNYYQYDKMAIHLGLNPQAESFETYLEKRLGAWRLQSFNATKMIDYREDFPSTDHLTDLDLTSETSAHWNKSSYPKDGGVKIVQKTGFPTPETRLVMFQHMMNMLGINQGHLGDTLAMAKVYSNQWAKLLSRARMDMSFSQGFEEDANLVKNDSKETKQGETRNSRSFKAPSSALSMKATTNIKGSNKLGSNNLESGQIQAGTLSGSKGAIRKTNKNIEVKEIGVNSRSSISNARGSSEVLSSANSPRSSANSVVGSSSLNSKRSLGVYNNDQIEEKELSEKSSSDNKDSKANKAKKAKVSKNKAVKGTPNNDIDFKGFEDMEFDDNLMVEGKIIAPNLENDGDQRVYQARKYAENQSEVSLEDQIHTSRQGSLFRIISRRYQDSGYKRLLNKK